MNLPDPITPAPIALAYAEQAGLIAGRYSAAVICDEPDGSISFYVASVAAQAASLALENDWGVDFSAIYVADPAFAAQIGVWQTVIGYPPPRYMNLSRNLFEE